MIHVKCFLWYLTCSEYSINVNTSCSGILVWVIQLTSGSGCERGWVGMRGIVGLKA